MNIEEKKKLLRGHRHYQEKLNGLYERLREIRRKAYDKATPGAIIHDDMPKSPNSSDWTDDIAKMLDEEIHVKDNIKYYTEKLKKIDRAMEELENIDVELAEVIQLRYFKNYKIPDIVKIMKYSKETIMRREKKAIEVINL